MSVSLPLILRGLAALALPLLLAGQMRAAKNTLEDEDRSGPRKTLLVLGGTSFIGPHLVAAAEERGWDVATFTRGKRPLDAAPHAEHLIGDRDPEVGEGLKALEGRRFDAVIDTSGHVPRHVRASAELLAPNVGVYLFVSSGSVYADHSQPGADEDAPLAPLTEETEDFRGEHFGPLKALCEQALRDVMPEKAIVVRPGLIVGPRDFSDRFTYWVDRFHRGGEVLAPVSPDERVMFIDVRDLSEWLLHLVAEKKVGTYNAIGPEGGMRLGDLFDACQKAAARESTVTWVDADFLSSQGVHGWMDVTLWLPPGGDHAGFHRRSIRRALDAGLTFRPVDETVAATLDWWLSLPQERRQNRRAGLAPEREAELLAAWHARDDGEGERGPGDR